MDTPMTEHEYRCPLCNSLLNRDKWIKITGQWEESKKQAEANKELIEANKKALKKAEQENKEILKSLEKEKKKAAREALAVGIKEGIKKEGARAERMSKMIQTQTAALQANNKKIQELEKQLKEGKTPQSAGFEYEKEVLRMLSETFPKDNIQSTGKMGDVLHRVMIGEEEAGTILYECKRTDIFQNAYINEILRHQESANADYAVIITHAQKKNKSNFFLEKNVLIIDPLGFLDLSVVLRLSLIEIHKMKLTKSETKQKGIQILKYMQAGEFKNYMVGNIEQTRKAYNLLMDEISEHKESWQERLKIYYTIHQNTQNVRKAIGQIVTGKQIGDSELEVFPQMEDDIFLLETGKVIK